MTMSEQARSGLLARVEAEGLDRFPSVIGDARRALPYALVVAQRGETWSTYFLDERGLVEEQSVRTYGDVEAAAADFLRLLRNLARIEEIRAQRTARRQAQRPQ